MASLEISHAPTVLRVEPGPENRPENRLGNQTLGGHWSIVGHEWATHFLAQLTTPQLSTPSAFPVTRVSLQSGEAELQGPELQARGSGLRHAYLFIGPAHIGKSTLALRFGQAILCADPQTRPCGKCRSCGLMERGIHPDFRLIRPTDKDGEPDRVNGLLRAEAANEIVREAALHPVEASYKVFLIQDAHRANQSFANKLLKTLEEPAPNVILCLTALDRTRLLPTIVSRCQTLELRPTPRESICEALMTRHGVDPDRAELLARLANGRMGWAIAQLDAGDDDNRLAQLENLWQLSAADSVERLKWAEKLATNRNNIQLFGMLELWVNWWRDVMLYQAGCVDACNNVDQLARLATHAESVPQDELRAYLATLRRIEGYLHHTVNTRLALEVLVLHLPKVEDIQAETR